MRDCKKCGKPFEARAINGIRLNKCNNCIYALQREKQIIYSQRALKKQEDNKLNFPTAPIKKKKKDPDALSTYKEIADRVFSIYIRMRDRGRCITCGAIYRWQDTDNGHYIPRAASAIRYDERNCNCQCRDCNQFKSGSQPLYKLALIEKYGEETVAELHRLKIVEKHFTIQELQQLINDYKVKIKQYEPANTKIHV